MSLSWKKSTSNIASAQNMMTGTLDLTERLTELDKKLRKLSHIPKIGLRSIKVIELGMKWRKFVPDKYKNDL